MNNSDNYAPALKEAFKNSSASRLYSGRQQLPETFDTVQSKMVTGEQTRNAIEDKEPISNVQHDAFLKGSVAASIERIRDSQNILQLLPDAKQTIEIMIGTIMSPKDMMTPTLTFKSNNKVFDYTAAPLLNYIRDYFVTTYKLEEQLNDMLWDILGNTGSYPIAVLPETAVDYMINSNSRVTFESIKTTVYENNDTLPSLGYIGGEGSSRGDNDTVNFLDFVKSVSTESFTPAKVDNTFIDKCFNITVLDNFDSLKLPLLKRKISKQRSHDIIQSRRNSVNSDSIAVYRQTSTESITAVDTSDYERTRKEKEDLAKLYPDRQFTATPIMRVRSQHELKKETVGHPLIIKLPTEAVVPIYNPANPKEHIGYYVLIDPTGNPLRLAELDNLYRMVQTSSNAITSGHGVMSYLLQQSANAARPSNIDVSKMSMAEGLGRASTVFQEMVERSLLERISNGSVGEGYKAGRLELATLIMLTRALAGKHTQLLYIPEDILSYLAVDYDQYGLGKTLLDDSKLLAAMRSMNMVVNSIASSKNAITKRVLDVALDPAEKNPQKALQIIIQEYVKGTQGDYPLTNNPVDQINYLQMAGVQVRTQDHPRLPSTNFGVDYIQNQYNKIDTDYDDYLKKLHIQGIGLSPELVEGAGSADFATQTVLANVLSARRIDQLSKKFCYGLSNFVRVYTYNDQILMDGLKDLVKTNNLRLKRQNNLELTEDEVVNLFVDSLSVSLPAPDTTQIGEQREAYNDQNEFYEEALKQFYNEEFMTEAEIGRLGGSDAIRKHQQFMKSYYMRNWMKENGVMNELFDMISVGPDGKPLIDFGKERDDFFENLSRGLMPMIKADMKRSGDINAELDKFEEGLANPPGNDEGGGGSYDSGDSGGGFDEGGMDDGGFDSPPDMTEEEPSEDTETESDTESNETAEAESTENTEDDAGGEGGTTT